MKASKYLGIAALIMAGLNLHAELVNNPDENTAWIENGKGTKNGGVNPSLDYWRDGTPVMQNPDGDGFIIDSNVDRDKQYATGRYINVSPDYPWLEWEVTEATPIPGKYLGFCLTTNNKNAANSDNAGVIPTGIFVRNLNDRGDFAQAGVSFLILYTYNAKVTVKHLKMVKKPDCAVEMIAAKAAAKGKIELGDEVTFKVTLKDSAEDVSLRFHRAYIMPPLNVNDEQAVQLKSEEGSDGKIWSATVPLKSISGDYKELTPGQLLIKAVVLGGAIKVPVWGTNSYLIDLNKKK
jgi:hypothetical protein